LPTVTPTQLVSPEVTVTPAQTTRVASAAPQSPAGSSSFAQSASLTFLGSGGAYDPFAEPSGSGPAPVAVPPLKPANPGAGPPPVPDPMPLPPGIFRVEPPTQGVLTGDAPELRPVLRLGPTAAVKAAVDRAPTTPAVLAAVALGLTLGGTFDPRKKKAA